MADVDGSFYGGTTNAYSSSDGVLGIGASPSTQYNGNVLLGTTDKYSSSGGNTAQGASSSSQYNADYLELNPLGICILGAPFMTLGTGAILSGTMLGGDVFTIVNSGISTLSFQDTFPGITLDTNKWNDMSSGGGSISVNNSLRLNVPTSGGTAAVRTFAQYKNFDVSVRFFYDNTVEGLSPPTEITFLKLAARIDASNNFAISSMWHPTKGPVIRVTETISGVPKTLIESSVKSSSRSLRLVRFGGRLLAYAGSNLLIDFRGWRDNNVIMELVSTSTGTPVPLTTTVSQYAPVPLVTFGDEVAPFASEVSNRIVGSTPAQKLPLAVNVKVHGTNSTFSLDKTFQYVAPLQLTLSAVGSTTIIVSNDDTLRDTTAELPGLRV